eukprot:EG_transcript_21271
MYTGTLRPDTNRHLSPDELESNINNLPVTERRLRERFDVLDVEGKGWISFDTMKAYYLEQENFGLPLTDVEATKAIKRYHKGDQEITFDVFSCIMLSIVQR